MAKAMTRIGRRPGTAVRVLTAATLGLGFLFGSLSPSWAASVCLPKGDLAKWLNESYEEGRIAAGVADGKRLVEVFSTGDGTTWTIVVTSIEGVSCVVATGEAWRRKEAAALEPQA